MKSRADKRSFDDMTFRAMILAIRQHSKSTSTKLKRIIIVYQPTQIKRINKRMQKYQKNMQKSVTFNDNIDLDNDDEVSFAYLFGVPKIPEITSSSSESDNDTEPNDVHLPYKHHSIVI